MFDDQPIDNNTNPPQNLPTAEPVDIFGDTETEDVKQTSENIEQKSSSTALDAGALRAKAEGVADEENTKASEVSGLKPVSISGMSPALQTTKEQPQSPAPEQKMEPPKKEVYEIKEPKIGKVIMIIVIVILGLVLLAGGSWWLYENFISEPSANVQNGEQEQQITPTTTEESGLTEEDVTDNEVLFGAPIDSDGDGLDDVREAGLGTDENNWDTDNDSLSDYDEVVIWKTDPINPDSDGDGYLDGSEVKSGYSPTGPGRLFELPVE